MSRKPIAVLLACLALPALAFAATPVDSKTSLNLGPKPGQFTGAVTADDPGCVAGRKVVVFRVEAGGKQKVAKDFSDINGLWQRVTDERSGTWFAKLRRERRGGLICRGDRSRERSAG